MRETLRALFGSVVILTVGCAAGEAVKQLNDQNYQAARKIELETTDPAAAVVAADIAANSEEIGKAIGLPEPRVPYSPEESERARKEAEQERTETGILGSLLSMAAGLFGPWGAAAGGIATTVWQWAKKRKALSIATAFAKGVSELPPVIQQLRADPSAQRLGDVGDRIKAVMSTAAEAVGVARDAERLIHDLRTSGTIRRIGSAPTNTPTGS